MEGFSALEGYFERVKVEPGWYDGEKVRGMIETFGPVFVRHLTDEIETITPRELAEIFPVEKDLEDNFKAMLAWIVASSSKLTTFPWVPLHCLSLGADLDHYSS